MSYSTNGRPQMIVEYALIIILVIIVIMVISRLFGPSIMDFIDNLLQTLTPTPEESNIESFMTNMIGLL
jgi:hypothetical protein